MIPTFEEWLENREFEGYSFGPAVLFDGGTQVAIGIKLPGDRQQAMRSNILFRSDTTDVVRGLKRKLIAWAKAKGYGP